jgi:molybdate transport system substrate-binding protein
VVYGSSGNLTTQIMNGAPFSLFIAADEHFPLELYKNGKTLNEGSVYAIGKLALIARSSSGLALTDNKAEIARAIMKANKIAIAKPELAPYGRAAVEYLQAEDLWDIATSKLVYGDNVGAATTYVLTGAADLGLTALSLAKSSEVLKEAN